jgi:hypothetical protein
MRQLNSHDSPKRSFTNAYNSSWVVGRVLDERGLTRVIVETAPDETAW